MKKMEKRTSIIVLLLITLLLIITCSVTYAKDIYIAQVALGDGSGSNMSNTRSVDWFNDSANWGEGEDTISPGTTVHLCGVISTGLSIKKGGEDGQPITILFEPDAKLSAPLWDFVSWQRTAIRISSDYIILDGGMNGIIEATDNGTALTNKEHQNGIWIYGGDFCEVKNLTIRGMYIRTPRSDDGGSG